MHHAIGGFISSLPRYQEPRPDGPNYRRGGSIPRNWDEKDGNQRFTGVNVASQWNHLRDSFPRSGFFAISDEELEDMFAENFATSSAHEDVHGLTDAEISEWAAHAVGGSPSNSAKTYFNIPKERQKDFLTLRSLAHEYGALTATEPERREEAMMQYSFAPYLTGEKDIADLHSASRE